MNGQINTGRIKRFISRERENNMRIPITVLSEITTENPNIEVVVKEEKPKKKDKER